MPRRGGGKGKYKSLKTGQYVSAYWAMRHPKRAARVDREVEMESKLQSTEIPLYAEEKDSVNSLGRGAVKIFRVNSGSQIEVWLPDTPQWLTPEEAYVIGSSLVEHAMESGYDYDTRETTPV